MPLPRAAHARDNPGRIRRTRAVLAGLACALSCVAGGCSGAGQADPSVTAESGAAVRSTTPQVVPARPGTVCAMLDAAAMSAILGEQVIAEPDDAALENGHSDCVYYSVDGHHPRIDVAVDRLGGDMMRGVLGIPDVGPATAEYPYADIGDGANLRSGVLFGMVGQVRVSIDLHWIDEQHDTHEIAEQVAAALSPKLAATS